jgi:hypothetical protein
MISNDPSEASTIDYVVTTDMSCQVTEDEIRRTTGFQGFPEFGGEPGSDHPLRILSEENLTVVSSFAGSLQKLDEDDCQDFDLVPIL